MLKTYNKNSEYSYTFGVAPTIEALEKKPTKVVKVLINPKGTQNAGITKIVAICEKLNIRTEINQKLIDKLSLSQNTYALAVIRKYETVLDTNNNHIVLVNPSDMGNLGTICRTMLGFNVKNLAIIKPAVDIFDPKVIRSTMGALFSTNFEYFNTFEEYKKRFNHNIYSFMSDGKFELGQMKFKSPYSLIFGNEGDGLGQEYKEFGESVRIRQSGNVDSFNLAVAVGIGLYKASAEH